MKMIAYAVEPEERPVFRRFQEEYGIELTMTEEKPGRETLALAQGMDAINVLSDTVITPELWDGFRSCGVRLAVTRCIGMEHMNRDYAMKLGIPVYNVEYSPASVADYAIMMMLMVLRHIKPMLLRYAGQDFTAAGLRGRELPNMTVGILGAGHIGSTVARHLSGFGCRVRYWSRSRKPELEDVAEYVPLDTLLGESDILTIHLSANSQTYHFMDRDRFAAMKPGAVLINTARGQLVDNGALIEALESGRLRGAGLDVLDGDRTIYYRDFKNIPVNHREMAVLSAMPNVLMLPHLAYFTDQALEDMVRNSLMVASEHWRA